MYAERTLVSLEKLGNNPFRRKIESELHERVEHTSSLVVAHSWSNRMSSLFKNTHTDASSDHAISAEIPLLHRDLAILCSHYVQRSFFHEPILSQKKDERIPLRECTGQRKLFSLTLNPSGRHMLTSLPRRSSC